MEVVTESVYYSLMCLTLTENECKINEICSRDKKLTLILSVIFHGKILHYNTH